MVWLRLCKRGPPTERGIIYLGVAQNDGARVTRLVFGSICQGCYFGLHTFEPQPLGFLRPDFNSDCRKPLIPLQLVQGLANEVPILEGPRLARREPTNRAVFFVEATPPPESVFFFFFFIRETNGKGPTSRKRTHPIRYPKGKARGDRRAENQQLGPPLETKKHT